MAPAGLWTTPYDLALFAREIMLAKEGKSDRVLSHVMVEMMLTPVKEGYGLGFILKGTGRDFQFSHGGSNEGFRCHMMAYPQRGQGAVIMTNGDLGGDLKRLLGLTESRRPTGSRPALETAVFSSSPFSSPRMGKGGESFSPSRRLRFSRRKRK
jgi:hypothetical protein